jgi:hypothetical protein
VWAWSVSPRVVEPYLDDYRDPFTVGVGSSLNPFDGAISAITTVNNFTVRAAVKVSQRVCGGRHLLHSDALVSRHVSSSPSPFVCCRGCLLR